MQYTNNKLKRFLLSGVFVVALLAPAVALAQSYENGGGQGFFLCQPSATDSSGDVFRCVTRVYNFAIVICSIGAVLYIIYGGYLYLFSAGNASIASKGKSFIFTSLTGLVILLAGFLILKQINPEILRINSISPQRILDGDIARPSVDLISGGKGIGGDNTGGAGHKSSELSCSYQGNKAQQVPNMTEALFQAIKTVCAEVKAKGLNPQISSITSGDHAPNSLHYKGCAIDFAGGDPKYTLGNTGKAVIESAKKIGLRINPGSDAYQTFHVHLDVGINNCKAPVIPVNQRG